MLKPLIKHKGSCKCLHNKPNAGMITGNHEIVEDGQQEDEGAPAGLVPPERRKPGRREEGYEEPTPAPEPAPPPSLRIRPTHPVSASDLPTQSPHQTYRAFGNKV